MSRHGISSPTIRRAQRQQMSTSKAVLALVLVWGLAALTAMLVVWLVRGDLPEIGTVAGVVAGIVAAEIGFYAWKAKAENIQKYGYKSGTEEDI